jgi:hypothetical protein
MEEDLTLVAGRICANATVFTWSRGGEIDLLKRGRQI